MNPLIKDKFLGSILGLAIGDALGVPFEMKKKDNIDFSLVGQFGESKYLGLGPGEWSDGTIVMQNGLDSLLLLCENLIKCKHWNNQLMDQLAIAMLQNSIYLFREIPDEDLKNRTFGKGTRMMLQLLKKDHSKWNSLWEVKSPYISKTDEEGYPLDYGQFRIESELPFKKVRSLEDADNLITRLGNGAALRVVPLALFLSPSSLDPYPWSLLGKERHLNVNLDERSWKELQRIDQLKDLHLFVHPILSSSSITHHNPLSLLGAILTAVAVREFYLSKNRSLQIHSEQMRILRMLRNTALIFESILHCPSVMSEKFASLEYFCSMRNSKSEFVNFSPEFIAKEIGTGGDVTETVPFAIAMALYEPNDFEKSISEAIKQGGDTDSFAALIGAMIGAYIGLSNIPEKYYKIKDFEKISKDVSLLIDRMYQK